MDARFELEYGALITPEIRHSTGADEFKSATDSLNKIVMRLIDEYLDVPVRFMLLQTVTPSLIPANRPEVKLINENSAEANACGNVNFAMAALMVFSAYVAREISNDRAWLLKMAGSLDEPTSIGTESASYVATTTSRMLIALVGFTKLEI